MPNYTFVPFNDLKAMQQAMHKNVAAVILEPVQGEGGVRIPSEDYLEDVSQLCQQHGALMIIDEIQTGFFRTGPAFAVSPLNMRVDFLTMAKGIAGGFPFGAFAMTEEIAQRIEHGDHGGTYCGNPLGCAVSHAVVSYLIEHDIERHVRQMSTYIMNQLCQWQHQYPGLIADVRGQGLLIAFELKDSTIASKIYLKSRENGLLLNLKHGTVLRIFPALNITQAEVEEGLGILYELVESEVA